jgi:NADPH-dependent curcumin reductase CurA
VLDEARFAFEEAPAAFARLATGDHFGKIIIDFHPKASE